MSEGNFLVSGLDMVGRGDNAERVISKGIVVIYFNFRKIEVFEKFLREK